MDFSLTEDQKMLRTMVREFAEKELEPIAAQIDEEARFPAESIKKMAELGLMGIPFPEKLRTQRPLMRLYPRSTIQYN